VDDAHAVRLAPAQRFFDPAVTVRLLAVVCSSGHDRLERCARSTQRRTSAPESSDQGLKADVADAGDALEQQDRAHIVGDRRVQG
jgi:hypothetical protein